MTAGADEYGRRVAHCYDATRGAFAQPVDDVLAKLLTRADLPGSATAGATVRALDLGCGTGNYLQAQIRHGPKQLEWFGLDPSADMLAIARSKVPGVRWLQGTAEQLPFATAELHYIISQFSFHHITDKRRALDQIARTLAANGILRIDNVAPEYAPQWWPNRYFPEAVELDQRRFWPVRQLVAEVEQRGFTAELTVTYRRRRQPTADLLAVAENRDMSQLALIDDAAYHRGMQRLRAEREPQIVDEHALLQLVAVRRRPPGLGLDSRAPHQ